MTATSMGQRAAAYDSSITTTRAPSSRVSSIDLIRGVIMILMAIDHVRVYSGVPPGGPTPGVFFTRWVTHFCAPGFAFFAGTAAFYVQRKLGDSKALAKYLATRGLLLVVLELTVLHVAWTFTFDFTHLLAGVIWMLGWCMLLMALLVRLPAPVVGGIGVAVIVGQSLIVPLAAAMPAGTHWLWQFLYLGGEVKIGSVTISILYVIVPWIGVMAAGYGFGTILTRDAASRRRLCLSLGVVATALFLAVAGAQVARQHPPNGMPPAWLRLLSQRKYPASMLFLLMTLGPMIALIPLAERARGRIGGIVTTYGRVPMFYYLLHIPLIHAVSLLVWRIRDGSAGASRFESAPDVFIPPADRWSLALLYLVFAIVVAALYVPCRWYAARKSQRPAPWMRYI